MNEHDDMRRIHQHMPAGQDLTLITLKAHLLAEELLDDIIEAHCKSKSVLEDVQISFSIKLKLAAALSGRDDLSYGWTMGEKLNSLRNSLAHRLEHPTAQQRLNSFLALYYDHPGKTSRVNKAEDLRSAIYLMFTYILGVRSSSLQSDEGSQIA
ncbi:hypothetical protein U5817_12160 [Aromatoleum evansii]|uniref:Apea-like HEPN domain-containing protein n=1 Tax=Aromatoleum evansii TaxID=59406 RepID=A0ABZ1AVB9_AROEV|nr:hypothetical protein U5817_12160 [Aromatoleum evansii]